MASNKNLEVVILSDEESKVAMLKGLLSNYYSMSIAQVCHHPAEAIVFLNKHHPTIFFVEMNYADILHDVKKPPFIVGLCDSINTKRVKQFLKMGFFEIFYSPFSEWELNSIMCIILKF